MSGLEQVFPKILSMSLSACYVIAIVIGIRVLIKGAPKIYSYLLWMIVFIRLLCPISIESVISLIPIKPETVTYERISAGVPQIDTNITLVENAVSTSKSSDEYEKPLEQELGVNKESTEVSSVFALSVIWLVGVAIILTEAIRKKNQIKKKVETATRLLRVSGNIYETDQISSPFLFGVFHPRIYVPVGLSQQEIEYILQHEGVHLKRRDHLVKLVAFLAVSLHWFNPFAWMSFYLMTKDMEMSCDEMVMKQATSDIRIDYSKVLLAMSMKQSGLLLPLYFGENNTKGRIQNVLNYKKPATWVGIIGILIIILAAITLLTTTKSRDEISLSNLGESLSPEVNELYGVNLTCEDGTINKNSTVGNIELTMTNYLEKSITYGTDYFLETKVDGQWYTVKPIIEDYTFSDESFELIHAHPELGYSKAEIKISLEPYKGHVTDGQYRIVKELTAKSDGELRTYYVGAEFQVENKVIIGSQNKYQKMIKGLTQNRTNYIGDSSKVSSLLNTLPVPEGLIYDSIELQTNQEPYELNIYYKLDSENLVDTIDYRVEYENVVLLFATIENMGKCTLHRDEEGGESKLTYYREELERSYGELFAYSENSDQLLELLTHAQTNSGLSRLHAGVHEELFRDLYESALEENQISFEPTGASTSRNYYDYDKDGEKELAYCFGFNQLTSGSIYQLYMLESDNDGGWVPHSLVNEDCLNQLNDRIRFDFDKTSDTLTLYDQDKVLQKVELEGFDGEHVKDVVFGIMQFNLEDMVMDVSMGLQVDERTYLQYDDLDELFVQLEYQADGTFRFVTIQ